MEERVECIKERKEYGMYRREEGMYGGEDGMYKGEEGYGMVNGEDRRSMECVNLFISKQ